MIIRDLNKIIGTDMDVTGPGWTSRRLLLAGDGMGFSLHDTLIHVGQELHLHYTNHLEAVYCIEGKGRITDKGTGKVTDLRPGIVYALNEHDDHMIEADEEMRMVCVFNPPVTGTEVHDETGAYPAAPADA